ncbi:MAG: signal peptidase II [Butyrivibrio sp.]
MNRKRITTYITAFLLFSVLVAIDQITKILAVQNLKGQQPVDIIKGVLQLTYVPNTGAAWGLMSGMKVFFIILTSILCIAIIFLFFITPMKKKYNVLRIILTVLGAGAVGNLIDRVMNGYVHDFIYFEIIDFPVFNVADICVTLSMFILIFLVIFKYKDKDFDYIKEFFNRHKNNSNDLKESADNAE